ncbi:MAG: hypothetical protein V3V35_01355 [Dehalococcoidia bacterium]
MAKVTAPLFSFGARGKLGDALVYFPWKGIEVVRTYVVPANPNSAAQQTQRGRLTNAVTDWHDIGLIAGDVTAWDRHAATRPSSMSGFNSFTSDHIAIQAGTDTPDMGFNATVTDDGDDTFTMTIDEDGAASAVDMIWGTSPTSLINTEVCTEVADTWTGDPTDNVAGQTIYARFEISDAGGIIGRTGIYRLVMA